MTEPALPLAVSCLSGASTAPHVLIVDDHHLDAELALIALRETVPDAQITVLDDSQEALEYLWREGRYVHLPNISPDLVLLDVNMPRLSGFEILRALRNDSRTKKLNVVLCSTSDDARDLRESQTLQANGYLVKPSTLGQLEAALRRVLAVVTNRYGAALPMLGG